MNTKNIKYIRISSLFILLTVTLTSTYFFVYQEWTDDITIIDVNISNGCTDQPEDIIIPLTLIRALTEDITSDAVLGTLYKHKKFIFNYGQVELNYYINTIYQIIGQNILRTLTFDILREYPTQINIKLTNSSNEHMCSTKEYTQFTNNILLKTDRNNNLFIEELKSTIFVGHIVLFTANTIIGIIIVIYLLYLSYGTIYMEWNKAIEEWIEQGSDDHSLYFLTSAKNKGVLDDFKHVACGPLFCSDHFIGSPEKNRTKVGYAVTSVFLHYMMYVISVLFIVAFSYYSNNDAVRTGIYIYICMMFMIYFIHSVTYYLDMRWRNRKIIARIFAYAYCISVFISLVYMINTIMWFLLCITIEPVKAIGMLVGFLTICIYIYYMYKKLNKIKNMSESSNKIKRKDMIIMIVFGTLILILLFVWMWLSWTVFSSNNTESLMDITRIVLIPLSAYGQAKKQMSDIIDKTNEDSDSTINIIIDTNKDKEINTDENALMNMSFSTYSDETIDEALDNLEDKYK